MIFNVKKRKIIFIKYFYWNIKDIYINRFVWICWIDWYINFKKSWKYFCKIFQKNLGIKSMLFVTIDLFLIKMFDFLWNINSNLILNERANFYLSYKIYFILFHKKFSRKFSKLNSKSPQFIHLFFTFPH